MMAKHEINVDIKTCVGCGLCAETCVAHNIRLNGKKAEIISRDCLMCGQCSAVCPKAAITIDGYEEKPVPRKEQVQLDAREVLNVIRFRRTIRQFQDKKIPEEIVRQILEAGRLTHTAKNMQDVSFVVLDKKKDAFEKMAVSLFRKLKPLADIFSPLARNNKIGDHFFFFEAPIVIVIVAKNPTNGILAAQNMEFVAEANGLGVLFSGYFTTCANLSRKIKKTLKIPRGKKAVATLVLGYPKVRFQRSAQREKLKCIYM